MPVTKKTEIHTTIVESIFPDTIRKRFSYPASDHIVSDWIEAQDNLSLSLRLMIHDEVKAHGLQDRVNRVGAPAANPAVSPSPDMSEAEAIARLLAQDNIRDLIGPLLTSLAAAAA